MEAESKKSIAVLFDKTDDNKSLQFYSIATVIYDEEDNYFIITSGEYEGSDELDFNSLECSPDSLLNPGNIVYREMGECESDKFIYVFPREYIDKIDEYDTDLLKYIYLAKKISNINLELTEDPVILMTKTNNKGTSIKNSEIQDMLKSGCDDEFNDFEVKDSIVIDKKDDNSKKEDKKQEEKNGLPREVNFDINKIINEISAKIVGQEEAITALVTNIYYNQVLIDNLTKNFDLDVSVLDSSKVAILLEGSTGTGKTAIAKEISSKLDLPIVIRSANSFSETGYVGPSITDILRKLYFVSGRNIGKAERGIVFLDEVDKIASTSKSNTDGKDMKKGVQEELLGFISGGEYDVPLDDNGYSGKSIHFDTSKLTFILSGAWTELREKKQIEAEKKNRQMGFGSSNVSNDDRTYTITAQDYIDDGLEREFFGRIKVLTHTKTYTAEDLKNILLYSSISPLKNFERTVKMFGYKGIICSENFIDELSKQAFEMGTGARALQTIMSGIQNKMLRSLINGEFDLDEPIELNENLLNQYNLSLKRRY